MITNISNKIESHSLNELSNWENFPILSLPAEVSAAIFEMLPTKDASRCSCVCKSWKLLLDHQSLWKKFFERDFPGISISDGNYKIHYKKKFLLPLFNTNFANVFYAKKQVRSACITSGLELMTPNSELLSIARETDHSSQLQLKNLETGRCLADMKIEGGAISQVQLTKSRIVGIGFDQGEIRIIHLEDECKVQSLLSHTSPITCLAFSPNEDVLFSGDATG